MSKWHEFYSTSAQKRPVPAVSSAVVDLLRRVTRSFFVSSTNKKFDCSSLLSYITLYEVKLNQVW